MFYFFNLVNETINSYIYEYCISLNLYCYKILKYEVPKFILIACNN